MNRKSPFGCAVVMALVILLVTAVLDFNGISYGAMQSSGAVSVVTERETHFSADREGTSGQDDAYGTSVPETPLREKSVTDDTSIYRTPLRIISVAAVALLLAWYIRKRMKL